MDIDKTKILDPEWASELQIDLQEYLMGLYESVDAEEDTVEYERGNDTASGQPFCGCSVCQGREILSFLSGKIIKGYQSGKIAFYDDDSSSSSSSIPQLEKDSSSVLACKSSAPS